jgi:hypothetical protein
MNTISDATILSILLLKRFSKNSGMVDAPKCLVIRRVRRPSKNQAKSEPISALPIPIQVDETPNFQPNCPAYPIKITAEKYEVPYANAVSQGPTFLPPSTKPLTDEADFLHIMPTTTIMAKNTTSKIILIAIKFYSFIVIKPNFDKLYSFY